MKINSINRPKEKGFPEALRLLRKGIDIEEGQDMEGYDWICEVDRFLKRWEVEEEEEPTCQCKSPEPEKEYITTLVVLDEPQIGMPTGNLICGLCGFLIQ